MKNKENQAKLREIESAGKENAGKGFASMLGCPSASGGCSLCVYPALAVGQAGLPT